MASNVAIANAGLRKVGATTITSFTQGTPEANFINDRFADIRNALLESHHWNFAVKQAKLAQLSTTPTIKWDYQYSLPADFIRSISVFGDDEGLNVVDHKIENNVCMSSASEVWMLYIAEVTDPNKMSPLFRELLATEIAVEAAIAIAESNTLREQMEKERNKLMRRARSADAMGDLPDRLPTGSWLASRAGRTGRRLWEW